MEEIHPFDANNNNIRLQSNERRIYKFLDSENIQFVNPTEKQYSYFEKKKLKVNQVVNLRRNTHLGILKSINFKSSSAPSLFERRKNMRSSLSKDIFPDNPQLDTLKYPQFLTEEK